MMETKFTPGPWTVKIVPCGKFKSANIATDGHRAIACVWPIDWDVDYDPPVFPLEANAHLIAAAPDLYAAISNSDDAHWTPAMRAALKKARGEQ
jgi:hypothetical protein